MPRRLPIVVACFLAIYLLWGSTYLAIAFGLKSFPPFMLMAVRSIAGGIILVALSWREISGISARAWARAAGCGLLFAGVALVALRNVSDRPIGAVAIALLMVSALSWAAGSLLSRHASSNASSLSLSGIQLTAGGAALLITSVATGEFRGFSPGAVTAPSLVALIYLIVAGSVAGFAAYHWLLNNVPTAQVSTYTFVNPVVAVMLGWLFLQEKLSPAMLVGGLMVIASVVAVWLVESRSSSERAERKNSITRSALAAITSRS